MGNCLSNIFIQRGMDLLLRLLQIRTSNSTENQSNSPNPDGPVDDLQDDIRADGVNRVRIEVPRQELTEDLLQEYLELERTAIRLERKQILSNWEAKCQLADDSMRTLVQLEARHKELKKQTEKARKDLEHLEQPVIRAHLRQQGIHQSRHEKAKELFDSAFLKEESSFKELAKIKSEYIFAQRVANRHREKCEKLENTHQRQEEIFCSVNGYSEYIELTNVKELESAQDWLQRVTLARFKWTNGRALLIHASIQLTFAINSWQELPQISGARSRYFTATEARNNFINSINNIQSCRIYLGRIRFPYVTEEELQTMELAIQNSFNDLQSNIALKKVMTISQGMQDKLNLLISWFDKVLNQTIIRDLDKANTNLEKLWTQTRELRLELFKKLVNEKIGREIDPKELEVENEQDNEEEEKREEEDEVENEEINLNEEEDFEEEKEVKIDEDVKFKKEENREFWINNKNNKFIQHYASCSNNLSFQNEENKEIEDYDVQNRIKNFEKIRQIKINNDESLNEFNRINNLQEKLRIRRYKLEKRQNEAKKLSEQFKKQWKSAINYYNFK